MATYIQWAEQIVATEHGNPAAVDGIVAWITAEHGAEGGGARNNPLDTTRQNPNGSPFNSAGVWNYNTPAIGLGMTSATLNNGLYGAVLAAISEGDNQALITAVGASPWGTSGKLMQEVYNQMQTDAAYRLQIENAEIPGGDFASNVTVSSPGGGSGGTTAGGNGSTTPTGGDNSSPTGSTVIKPPPAPTGGGVLWGEIQGGKAVCSDPSLNAKADTPLYTATFTWVSPADVATLPDGTKLYVDANPISRGYEAGIMALEQAEGGVFPAQTY